METFLIGAGFLLMALLGTPLFAIIGVIAMLAFNAQDISPSVMMVDLNRIATNPTLVAIPLFTFAGYALAESKAPTRMVNLARALFGAFPGGLAVVVLVTCALFTAFTGASGVTIVALGGLLYPMLLNEQYPERFSLGLITTSGSLGLLFPPASRIILYALVTTISVDKLFAAGIVPGLLLVVALSSYAVWQGVKFKVPRHPFTWAEAGRTLRAAAWEIPLPIIIIGGIYTRDLHGNRSRRRDGLLRADRGSLHLPRSQSLPRRSPRDAGQHAPGRRDPDDHRRGHGADRLPDRSGSPAAALRADQDLHHEPRDVPGGAERLPDHRRHDDGYFLGHHRRGPAHHADRRLGTASTRSILASFSWRTSRSVISPRRSG